MSEQSWVATEYAVFGLSVIPLRLDGSKAPAVASWQDYQSRIADQAEIERWFSRPAGIGIVGGVVSGGLEILDFDDGSLFEPFRKLVEPIVCRLPVVETPSGGWHVFYRCCEIGGNNKIALDPSREKRTLVETRGQGGYVAAVGSAPGVHSMGDYQQVAGPALPIVPEILPDERRQLFAAARTFDKRSKLERKKLIQKYQPRPVQQSSSTTHPVIAWFNERHSWAQILEPHGWRSHDGIRWTRPGKTCGVSASVVHAADGTELLTVYSGNAGPLAPSGAYRTINKFEAHKLLVHRGDNSAAFRAAMQEAQL